MNSGGEGICLLAVKDSKRDRQLVPSITTAHKASKDGKAEAFSSAWSMRKKERDLKIQD